MGSDRHCSKWKVIRRPKGLVIAGLVVALLGGVAWHFASDPDMPIQVFGTLAPEDVNQLKRLARHEAWHRAFPDFSWSTIQQLPKKLRPIRAHVFVMLVSDNGDVSVTATVERGANIGKGPTYSYHFARSSNSWRCTGFAEVGVVHIETKPFEVAPNPYSSFSFEPGKH
ncbi:hypothetical protein [Pedosphaera parvula]|uniref:Uncharacterized protein n=1 Tax=Pedosphaera parvula (strain Ellin514) TaxID=320771 RepID=B9XDH3_PEDPL|nr:hypothetical protein [Pedosphaera parvula]EEF62119.1 hypothetical protein Cflav_PD6394 [Pedosphaera parvula Ellin514]